MKEETASGLKFSTKLAYAIGQVTDSIGYNAFYFFYLFFLTDFVGIPPRRAGTIILITVLWDALTDPFVGQFSDNLKSKYGRRRPLMLIGIFPYALFIFLLFNNINSSPSVAYYYYLIITLLFWSAYKIYVIPFFSLGAELTGDFNERTSLRSWASISLYGAVLLSSSLPPYVVDKVESLGYTRSQGWNAVGLIFALIIIVTGLISWNFTRGSERIQIERTDDEPEKLSLIKNLRGIIQLKPIKTLALSVFLWSSISAMYSGGAIYLLKNNLSYSAARQSSYFFFLSFASLLWVPVINFLGKKIDKKLIYVSGMFVGTISLLLFAFLKFPTYGHLIVFSIFYAYSNSVFWTIYYSMMYDITELDEFINNLRREGIISSLLSFCQKIGAAIAAWAIGFILQLVNYDQTTAIQTSHVERTILYLVTLIPAIVGIVATILAFLYPLTRVRFEALALALKRKKKGQDYDVEGFKKLL